MKKNNRVAGVAVLFGVFFIMSLELKAEIETVPVDYKAEPVKLVLREQEALRRRDYKTLWDSVTKTYKEIFNDKYNDFKTWHLTRRKNEPQIEAIFADSHLKEIKNINENRKWVEFYKSEPKLQEEDPTLQGYYLVREDGIWKLGSIAKYIRIKIKDDFYIFTDAIKNYYNANNRLPQKLADLLSPIVYISKIPLDVFNDKNEPYIYKIINGTTWMIYSYGPDSDDDLGVIEYDMKNGPISDGDIVSRMAYK